MHEWLTVLQTLFLEEQWKDVYLVGGCVRDYLLNRLPRDLDLVVTLPGDALRSAGFRPVVAKSSVAIWFRHLPGLGNLEATLIPSRAALADDLQRRDFTVNAIALDMTGRLFDPLQGLDDLQHRRLRACSASVFRDDPLRLFRALRFEAEEWQTDATTEALIRQHPGDSLLSALPVERFSREMLKALAADQPERFFQRMLELGIGTHWLGELFRMAQIPAGPLQYHPEGDLFSHSMQVMQRVAAVTRDPLARFCALLHDIGKLSTDPAQYPKHHGHDAAGFAPARELCRRLKLPAAWGRALAWTARLHTKANNWHELRPGTRLKLADQARKAGISTILPLVSAADKPGHAMHGWETALAVTKMSAEQLGIPAFRLAEIKSQHRSGYLLQKRIELLACSVDET